MSPCHIDIHKTFCQYNMDTFFEYCDTISSLSFNVTMGCI